MRKRDRASAHGELNVHLGGLQMNMAYVQAGKNKIYCDVYFLSENLILIHQNKTKYHIIFFHNFFKNSNNFYETLGT